jgi:Fe2+ transport system protein FeoA
MVSPEHSHLARASIRLARALRRLVPRAAAQATEGPYTLADAPVATDLRIVACSTLEQEHRDWLQAYGVQPGHCVRVLQHRPVTIIQAGQDELALERPIAQAVQVEAIAGPAP